MRFSKLGAAGGALIILVAGCGSGGGKEGGQGLSATPAPLSSAPQGQESPGESQPPSVGPSAQPWQTPRLSTGSGASLNNRTPNNVCRQISAPYPVRIESFRAQAVGGPEARNADDLSEAARAAASFAQVTYGSDAECAGLGSPAPRACAPDTVISSTESCGVGPQFLSSTSRPALPAKYTVRVTWSLSKLCTDATTGPCRSIQGAQPGPGRPVRATWQATTDLPACVEWVPNSVEPYLGESLFGQC
ncbi:hypothetical protein [Actinomadura sp. 3N508]|uniref:hypothetical protein n=1 Tax=Actinomadura sp. 3N508 TaxID=3375153 RepID=UPI003788B194